MTIEVHYGPPCRKCGNRLDVLIDGLCELCTKRIWKYGEAPNGTQ